MFSTTVVLNLCQARNDSGSLTPILTGLVTTSGLLDVLGIGSKPKVFLSVVADRLIFSLLFALPLALIGLGMTSSPFWAWRMAFRTFYVITNQRVLIYEANPLSGTTLRSIPPEDLHRLSCREFADGSGDLVFDNVTRDPDGRRSPYENGFIGIARVREAEDMIRMMFPQD
jgi:hypothetical protein